jgi:hypothetical protein
MRDVARIGHTEYKGATPGKNSNSQRSFYVVGLQA